MTASEPMKTGILRDSLQGRPERANARKFFLKAQIKKQVLGWKQNMMLTKMWKKFGERVRSTHFPETWRG